MVTNTDALRAQFEKLLSHSGRACRYEGDGQYAYPHDFAWLCYQAGHAAAIAAAPATRPDTDHKAIGLAYGWLWHATTSDSRIHAARAALLGQLSRDDQRAGIRAARAAGASVDEAALEAALNRGDAL